MLHIPSELRSAQSEYTLDKLNKPPLSDQAVPGFIAQLSQDDSTVGYAGNHAPPSQCMDRKSYSVDVPLTQLKSERYSCNLLVENFLLARAAARGCNSTDTLLQSDALLNLIEVEPINGSCGESENFGWKMSLDPFRIRKYASYKHLSRKVRNYYQGQNELIRSFEETERLFSEPGSGGCYSPGRRDVWPRRLSIISLLINLILLVVKAVAVHLSASMAIISSLVDSAVDIVASVIILWTSTAVVRRDPYVYPEGRTRLEPIAVIILSILMSLAAIQLVVEALERIVYLRRGDLDPPSVGHSTVTICLFAIAAKLTLYLACRGVSSRSVLVKALQMDHRNDVFSNTMAVICAFLGSQQMIAAVGEGNLMYADPLGAVFMSAYILANWWHIGIEQIKLLTGLTATPQFLSKLTWISLNHHHKLKQVDTVRAFHCGNNFLVEVDIVLPRDMRIRESHDIGESLQHKLEKLAEVERAFVHLDYETTHDPLTEHKVV